MYVLLVARSVATAPPPSIHEPPLRPRPAPGKLRSLASARLRSSASARLRSSVLGLGLSPAQRPCQAVQPSTAQPTGPPPPAATPRPTPPRPAPRSLPCPPTVNCQPPTDLEVELLLLGLTLHRLLYRTQPLHQGLQGGERRGRSKAPKGEGRGHGRRGMVAGARGSASCSRKVPSQCPLTPPPRGCPPHLPPGSTSTSISPGAPHLPSGAPGPPPCTPGYKPPPPPHPAPRTNTHTCAPHPTHQLLLSPRLLLLPLGLPLPDLVQLLLPGGGPTQPVAATHVLQCKLP